MEEQKIEKILDNDHLLRRVRYPNPSYIRDDMTVTPFAFRLRKNQNEITLSVDIERLTTYEKSIQDITQYRLFMVIAKQVRTLGCDCVHTPEPDNYAHAGINGNITNSIASQLAKAAIYINYPVK